jgi:aminocarboxymuconate-semialdehyde decarboxylase
LYPRSTNLLCPPAAPPGACESLDEAIPVPIDVHAHYVPPQLIAAVRARGADIGVRLVAGQGGEALQFDYGFKVRPFFARLIEPAAARKAWLAEKRIDHQVVGTWPDIFAYGLPPQACAGWHRMLNDTLGEWCAEHAAQFSWIASVPMPDADAAAAELERAVGRGAVGAIVASNVEGINLGEVALDAFWQKAEVLDVPILIHPVMSTPAPRAARFALAQIAQYTFDTTLGVGSLLFSGVLDRFPGLTLVLSHGGGAFPYLMGRFDLMHERMDRTAQGDVAAKPPSAYGRLMAYDSIVHGRGPLRFLADTVGLDRVLLGTDYSFPPADLDPLASLAAAGFSAADTAAVADANPRRFFKRIKG